MPPETTGLHHVTAIVGDAQRNLDHYAGVLGLRLVKQTVNFEDLLQHHLYYGNRTGNPGTVITTFPSPEADPGRVGQPQVGTAAFAIPPDSLEFWHDRLDRAGIDAFEAERFGYPVVAFSDADGTSLELVPRDTPVEPWTDGPVPTEHAIRGLHGVTVIPTDPYGVATVLETLGFELVAETENLVRYVATPDTTDDPGDPADTGPTHETFVDIDRSASEFGREGTGTHHHVAVTMPDEDALHAWRDVFDDRGYHVSRVKDRHYFHSLYVRGPGGVLIELATTQPGITANEDLDTLGESLSLPDWFEHDRDMIERQLPDLELPDADAWRDPSLR